MRVSWYGQSAFELAADEASVFIDPFGDVSGLAQRGMQFDYPAIEGVEATLLLVTHEHLDHNGVEAIGGSPAIIRSTGGTLESPIGEVVAIASEHDPEAGTRRGPNTIFVFTLDGLRIAHFGDFGPGGAARGAGARDRLGRPAVHPGRRRSDDRPRAGGGDRRAAEATLDGANALPHGARRLPRTAGRVSRARRRRASRRRDGLRHGGGPRRSCHAGRAVAV